MPVNLTLFLGGLTLGKPLQHTFYGRYYQIRFFYFKPSTLFCQTVPVANVMNWVLRQAGKEKLVVWIGVGFVFSWLRSPLLFWYQALTAVGPDVPFCLQSQPYPTCKFRSGIFWYLKYQDDKLVPLSLDLLPVSPSSLNFLSVYSPLESQVLSLLLCCTGHQCMQLQYPHSQPKIY